jgi:hypothetical protein
MHLSKASFISFVYRTTEPEGGEGVIMVMIKTFDLYANA